MAINPYAPTSATGNGSQVDFSFTFPYLATTHIKAYLNGVQTTAFTFFSSNVLRLTTAPAAGTNILITRETPVDTLSAVIQTGGPLPVAGLNNNFLQNLYYSQETQYDAANQSTAGLQAQITAATNTANTALTVANTNTTFTQTGVGAVGRTVTSKLAERVSVKDFGATGDGTTDDSAAIQAAINAVFPRGTIYFPEGIYYVNSRIYITGAGISGNIEFVGDGGTGSASELRAGPGLSNTIMFTFVDSDCGVRGLYFNANTATNSTAIEFQGDNNNGREYVKDSTFVGWANGIVVRTDSYTISGCYAINCTNFIVGANWAMNASITDNYTLGVYRSVWLKKDYTAAVPQQPEGVRIINNCFLPATNGSKTIDIECGLEILIQGNILDQSRTNSLGINLEPKQSGDVIAYVKILDNWIDGGDGVGGACILGTSLLAGTNVSRVWIERNTFVGGGVPGTIGKPSVYLNTVQAYWLINNALISPTSVTSFQLPGCIEGNRLGNSSRVTNDPSITKNVHANKLTFTADVTAGLNSTWEANAGSDTDFHFCGLRYNNSATDLGIAKPYGYSLYLQHGGALGPSGGLTIGTANSNAGPLNFVVGGQPIVNISTSGILSLQTVGYGLVRVLTFGANPEGNITANPGSICLRTDTGILYVKQGTGTGNTGWVAK